MATREGPATAPRGSLLAAAGAVGGAVLVLGGQIAFDAYKEWRTEAQSVEAKAEMDRLRRDERLAVLAARYEAMGEVPQRASAFIDGASEGSVSDVRAVVRHYRELTGAVFTGEVDRTAVVLRYGGRLRGWGRRLGSVAEGSAPVAAQFSASERTGMGLIAAALGELARYGPSVVVDDDPIAEAWYSENATDVAEPTPDR